MPLPMPSDELRIPSLPAPSYPAVTKHAAGMVDGVPTHATCIQFTDKIMVTVTQGGRLGQWVSVHYLQSAPRELTRKSDPRTS